jgi:tRNA nucleotidyltransferase (CCA-adding enzyme)
MKLDSNTLKVFISNIKLKEENMPDYRRQINYLKEKLEDKIKNDDRTGLKVTKYLLTGSWKKRTILRPKGDNPIDIDLVLFVEGDENIADDLPKLHDYIVEYLQEIYPGKDISKDVDAEGKTKSIKIRFTGTGLELDIVPVIPTSPTEYVIQPQRGGGKKPYITSVSKQLEFAKRYKDNNPSYTSIVRALKW